jgi:hypothetical protein
MTLVVIMAVSYTRPGSLQDCARLSSMTPSVARLSEVSGAAAMRCPPRQRLITSASSSKRCGWAGSREKFAPARSPVSQLAETFSQCSATAPVSVGTGRLCTQATSSSVYMPPA